jgi:penicillin-insensitive murein endopeptidase
MMRDGSLPARAVRLILLALAALAGAAAPALAQATQSEEMARRASLLQTLPDYAAKKQFGMVRDAAPMQARAIGSYARGCLAGATALPVNGGTWQVMRTSRNRNWGHPELVALLERFARAVPKEAGWPGILVGDISQPRGGPMLTGHASHQIGLDADIWLTPMPTRRLSEEEREFMSATNMARADWMDVDEKVWTPNHTRVIRLAALEPAVDRIFVNPALKKALCREATGDRGWLSKVRPMWGHNYHFHIRIGCPAGMEGCADQDPPPEGDGCGKELTDWLALQHKAFFGPKKRPGPKKPPPPPMSVDALPPLCKQVLVAR